MDAAKKREVEDEIGRVKEALKSNADTEALRKTMEALSTKMQAVSSEMYAHAKAQQPGAGDAAGGAAGAGSAGTDGGKDAGAKGGRSGGGKEDVIDADFEMVDDKKK